MAKRADQRYLPGERGWVKVKHRRTLDVVIICGIAFILCTLAAVPPLTTTAAPSTGSPVSASNTRPHWAS